MSTLTLTVLRSPDAVVAERRQIHGGELTIGRSNESDWTLADPAKSLSRKHCTLRFLAGGWQIEDRSVNGTFVNYATAPVGQSQVQPLQDGDRLRLGDYEIEVRIEQPAQAAGYGAAPSPYGAASPFAADPPPFGAAQGSPFANDPPPFGAGAGAPLPFGAGSAAPLPFGAGGGAAPLPFGAEPAPAPLPFGDAPRGGGGGFGGARLPGLDDPVPPPAYGGTPRAGAVADHSPAISDAFQPPAYVPAAKQLVPDDWLNAVVPATPPAAPRTPQPVADAFPAPAPGGYATAMPASPMGFGGAAAEVVTAPPARPMGGGAAGADLGAALALLLAGGELAPDMAGRATNDPAATLRNAGALLNAAVAGLRALLIARGSVKREFRIEQTMLRRKENNPLKFSQSDEQALAALLDPRTNALGFLQESINDLTAHQVAVLAATQAAARALLEQLDPAKLVAADPGGGLLPGAQEKRLWEAYKRRHAQMQEQFEDDFESAFGTAFARAYEQAVERRNE